MRTKIIVWAAALLLVIAGLVGVQAPKASAAFWCPATGLVGSPKISSLGGDTNPIILYDSAGRRRNVYYGHPQYFCPSKVHVNWNRNLYVFCDRSLPLFWFKRWGTHPMKNYCQVVHSSIIRFSENRK